MPFRSSTSLMVQKGVDKRKEVELMKGKLFELIKVEKRFCRNKSDWHIQYNYIVVIKVTSVNTLTKDPLIYTRTLFSTCSKSAEEQQHLFINYNDFVSLSKRTIQICDL